MSANANSETNGRPKDLPPWADCDVFCIRNYAGTEGSRCGWRGRLHDVPHDPQCKQPVCPRCGCATLMRIPLEERGL